MLIFYAEIVIQYSQFRPNVNYACSFYRCKNTLNDAWRFLSTHPKHGLHSLKTYKLAIKLHVLDPNGSPEMPHLKLNREAANTAFSCSQVAEALL